MAQRPQPNDDGSLDLANGVIIPAREITIRLTTSGGPGGQHANRTLSRVVARFDIVHSGALDDDQRRRLVERLGSSASASSSTSRSQLQNRERALTILAERLAEGLEVDPARRATRPSRSSVARRLESKKRRSQLKSHRRRPEDD